MFLTLCKGDRAIWKVIAVVLLVVDGLLVLVITNIAPLHPVYSNNTLYSWAVSMVGNHGKTTPQTFKPRVAISEIRAQRSHGCHHPSYILDLEFRCTPAIDMTDSMSLVDKRQAYYKFLLSTHVLCRKTKLFGHSFDGGWHVCLVPPYQLEKDDCIVYSIGIGNDWSFDESISNTYGCKIYSFDPTIKLRDHKHSQLVWFYNTGLSGTDNDKNQEGWRVRTLCMLFKELGHSDTIIDMVKFDIEFSEWAALITMVTGGCLERVKQIALEVHSWQDTDDGYVTYWQALQGLENVGFQRWRVDNRIHRCFNAKDDANRTFCPQADLNYINLRFLPSIPQ